MPHVIVIGNEKGGSGKSTTAIHVITALVRDGHAVGAIDLDQRQQSLYRYLDNRQDYMRRHGIAPPPLSEPAMVRALRTVTAVSPTIRRKGRYGGKVVDDAFAPFPTPALPGSGSMGRRDVSQPLRAPQRIADRI